jgi:hypothetical protein
LTRGYSQLVRVISPHENYEHVLELVKTLSRMVDILLEWFRPDDPLIDEFEELSIKFLTLVVTLFEGRIGCRCHIVDPISSRRMSS